MRNHWQIRIGALLCKIAKICTHTKKNHMQIQVNLFLFISRPGKKCLLESNLQIRYDLMSNNGEMSIQTVTLKWAKKKKYVQICKNMQMTNDTL